MYCKNCTAKAAVEFVNEIIAKAENERRALSFVKMFLNNDLTITEVRKWLS